MSQSEWILLRTFAFCGIDKYTRELEEEDDWGWIFFQMGNISPCLQIDRNDPTVDIKVIFLVSFVLQLIWSGMNACLDKGDIIFLPPNREAAITHKK